MSNRTETGEMLVWATGFVCDAEVCMVEGVEGYVLLYAQYTYLPAQAVPNTGRADVQFTRSDGAVFSYRWVDPDSVPVPRLSTWVDRDVASAWLQDMVRWAKQGVVRETCGCTWNGPGDGCRSGYVLFANVWELSQFVSLFTSPEITDEAQDRLWDEYERWIGWYAAHMGEPVPVREVSGES